MIAIWGALWWLTGGLAMMWLRWQGSDRFTWGDFAVCCWGGLLGPIFPAAVGISIGILWLKDAEFWEKPIFAKRR